MLLLLAATMLVTADPSAPPAVAAPTPVVAAKPVKERRVCRDLDNSTSRLGRRVCKTESEWSKAGTEQQSGSRSTTTARPND
jgi:hypothetical protein